MRVFRGRALRADYDTDLAFWGDVQDLLTMVVEQAPGHLPDRDGEAIDLGVCGEILAAIDHMRLMADSAVGAYHCAERRRRGEVIAGEVAQPAAAPTTSPADDQPVMPPSRGFAGFPQGREWGQQ